jgi:anti-sigma factor RsiW
MNADIPARWEPCEDYAFDLMELGDGTLPPERARVVRMHLEGCTRCRHWMADLTAIGSELAAAMPRPELSADFDARLEVRIDQLRARQRTQRGELQAAVEREHDRMVAALRRGLRWRTALNAAATASAAGGLLVAARALGPELADTLGLSATSVYGWSWTTVMVVVVSVAGAVAARRWLGSPSPSLLFG